MWKAAKVFKNNNNQSLVNLFLEKWLKPAKKGALKSCKTFQTGNTIKNNLNECNKFKISKTIKSILNDKYNENCIVCFNLPLIRLTFP